MNFRKFFSFCLFILSNALLAVPPPTPSAGVVEREIQQEYEAKPLDLEKDVPSVEVEIPSDRLSMQSKEVVKINSFTIIGNEVFSEREIIGWIEEFLNQNLTISEIYQLCQVIDQNYAKKGYFLTRSYPPPQCIKDQVLVIKILEGRIGKIQVEGNRHYSTRFIERYFERFCKKPLNYNDFLKKLLLLNENTDLRAGVLFQKGKEVGTADLIIQVKDKRLIHLYLNENNYGRKLTTNTQLGGRFDWGNSIFYGDTLSIAEVIGFPINALYFTDATYRVPLNTRGTFLELGYLFSKFHIEELYYLRLRGKSQIGTIKATHAIQRTKKNRNRCFWLL